MTPHHLHIISLSSSPHHLKALRNKKHHFTWKVNFFSFNYIDINECAANGGIGDCENGATCTNTDGSFICSCVDGWTGALCTEGKITFYLQLKIF